MVSSLCIPVALYYIRQRIRSTHDIHRTSRNPGDGTDEVDGNAKTIEGIVFFYKYNRCRLFFQDTCWTKMYSTKNLNKICCAEVDLKKKALHILDKYLSMHIEDEGFPCSHLW